MESIRIGMVGYKFMGKAHSHAYKDLPLFFPNTTHPEMKVICGRNPDGVSQAARQFGWEEYTTDWKSLLQREDIDLIDINAPSDVHKEITIAAAKYLSLPGMVFTGLAGGSKFSSSMETSERYCRFRIPW